MESKSEDKPESKKLGKINDDETLLDKIYEYHLNKILAIFIVLIIIGLALVIGGSVSKMVELLGVGLVVGFGGTIGAIVVAGIKSRK